MNMANVKPHGRFVALEGLDGSGKSTTAHEAVQQLSEAYPKAIMKLTDSDGIYEYVSGEQRMHCFGHIDELGPQQQHRRAGAMMRLGAFAALRMAIDHVGLRSDLLVGVRDPHRILPATYSSVMFPGLFGRMSTSARLRLFDAAATVRVPDGVVVMQAEVDALLDNMSGRSVVASHEDPEHMAGLHAELPLVIDAFARQFSRPVHTIEALQQDTTENLVMSLEPFVDGRTALGAYSQAA
jgi:hypothetical protein